MVAKQGAPEDQKNVQESVDEGLDEGEGLDETEG